MLEQEKIDLIMEARSEMKFHDLYYHICLFAIIESRSLLYQILN